MVVRSAVVVFGLVEAHALPSAAVAVPYFVKDRQASSGPSGWGAGRLLVARPGRCIAAWHSQHAAARPVRCSDAASTRGLVCRAGCVGCTHATDRLSLS